MKRFLPIATWLVALFIVAAALLYFETDLLWKLQEQNLFLDTWLFFREQMVVPGGLLSWAGTWLTQFFFYPWLGVLLLCACWLLLMWTVKRAFKVADQWSALMLVPVALLLLTIVDMGYWVYMLKLAGHAFVGTLGAIAVAALLWLFRVLPQRFGLRLAFIGVTALLGYPLLGIYGLAATLLMGIYVWHTDQSLWQKIVGTALALTGVVFVPLLCYRHVYYQTNLANIYYARLPLFVVSEEHHAYYLPYYGLALFFVLMVAWGEREFKGFRKFKGAKRGHIIVQCALVALLAWGVAHWWFRDENFHHELKMQHCIEQGDWQGVVTEAARQEDEPTRAIVMMRNLALSRLGRQGDDMYLFKNGSKHYEAPFGMRLMLCVGPLIYYHYGMLNYSARLCTEMGVEFGWHVSNLKCLAKCSILNKEEMPARKYLGLLRHTTFYGDWADRASEMEELKTVQRMMHYSNMLGDDQGNIERFLMNRLAESTYRDDEMFQEQTLLATLWTKDVNLFWYHFNDYTRMHPNARIPRYFQEAAYLYGKLHNIENIDRMPFDPSVRQSFDSFMQMASQYNKMEADIVRKGMKAFSNTYYYDYYLMRDLAEY